MVKITPVVYSYLPNLKDNRQYSVQLQTNQEVTQSSTKSFQCSFLGDFVPNFPSVDLTPVLDIGDITCPACGVKTLSEAKFQSLIDEAEKIDSPIGLIKFFKANKDYIPLGMRNSLFADEKLIRSNRNFTICDYFTLSKQRAYTNRYDCFSEIKNYLSEYSKTLSDSDLKNSINDAVMSIDNAGGYQDFKNIFFPLVNRPDFDKEARDYLVFNLFVDLRTASLNFGVYGIQDFKEMSQNELAKSWASKIFSNSLIKHSKIHGYNNLNNINNNSVLVCSSCAKKAHPNVFMDFRSIEDVNVSKFFLQNYLSNIARLMGEGKIQSNRYYFNNFAYSIRSLSKGKIEFSKNEIDRLLTLRALTYRHESFAPIEQSDVDVPCASCGTVMLPHSKRMDIQLELITAKGISEYAEILNRYNKYIGIYAKDFKNIFLDVYNKYPGISQDDFIKEFYKRADYVLKNKVFDAVSAFDKNSKYTEVYGTKEQLELIGIVRDRLIKYLDDGQFDDYNYSNLLRTVMAGINLDSTECSKSIYMMLNDMKTIAYMSSLITPNDKYDNADTNPLFTLLFNFFKTDVATGDFLLASKKGGKGLKENLIGLCKGCNNMKSNKGVEAWYTQVLSVRKNFRKQLHVIDEMAKCGKIEGYDDWAKSISNAMYTLTRGRYDIRDEFEKQS